MSDIGISTISYCKSQKKLVIAYTNANVDLIHDMRSGQFISTTGGNSRIDFVYVTPALRKRIRSASVIRDSYTTPVRNPQKISNFWHPSDHCPILVHFKL